jgi:DNA adenine methylase
METFTHRSVRPISPPAAYIGGKKQLAPMLVDLIEEIPHATYAEPFVGMGGVFFRRRRAPQAEVINDRSGCVTTLFRILQRHYVPFMDMLKWQFTTRRDFDRLVTTDPATLTDLERAARFLYLQRLAFGGKVSGRSFGVSPGMPGRFDVGKLGPMLEAINERLSGVIIENLGYDAFIARYDGPDALFYLDPPYWGCEGDYGAGTFDRSDFRRLADALAGIAGRFVLSINDTLEVREIFAAFDQAPVSLTYTIGAGAPKDVGELVITPRGMPRHPRAPGLFG